MYKCVFCLLLLCGLFGLVSCGAPVGYTKVMGETVASSGDYGVITIKNSLLDGMIKNVVIRAPQGQCSPEEARDVEIWPTQEVGVPVAKNYYGDRVRLEVTGDVYTENEPRPIGYIREIVWVSEQAYYGRFGQQSSDSSFLVISRIYPLRSVKDASRQGWR